MLERVMRRFGVSAQSRSREPTYYEALLRDSREAVARKLAGGDPGDALDRLVLALVETEAGRHRLPVPVVSTDDERARLREYVVLLRDNDVHPQSGQLSRDELRLVRQLLVATGEGAGGTGKVYEKVLVLLEEKFSGGLFAQAAMLLRLFETTAARRRGNEKTLFYEEMIARFGLVRVQRIATHLVRRFQKAMLAREDSAQRILGAARWLGQAANVRLHVRRRLPREIESWAEPLEGLEPEVREAARELVTPSRWRPVGEEEGFPLVAAVREHLAAGALTDYTERLLRAVYFIAVVTTRTGFEPLIRDYFQWVERQFRFPGARLLPRLHRWTTLEERSLDDSVKALREEHFGERLERLLEEVGVERVEQALVGLSRQLRLLEPNDLPPGDYDLTGLLLDHMTGFTTQDASVPYRVHRLC
jgi:hypothetical protein